MSDSGSMMLLQRWSITGDKKNKGNSLCRNFPLSMRSRDAWLFKHFCTAADEKHYFIWNSSEVLLLFVRYCAYAGKNDGLIFQCNYYRQCDIRLYPVLISRDIFY